MAQMIKVSICGMPKKYTKTSLFVGRTTEGLDGLKNVVHHHPGWLGVLQWGAVHILLVFELLQHLQCFFCRWQQQQHAQTETRQNKVQKLCWAGQEVVNITASWEVMPCSLVHMHQHLRQTCIFRWKLQAICSSKKLSPFYWITWHHMYTNSNFHFIHQNVTLPALNVRSWIRVTD